MQYRIIEVEQGHSIWNALLEVAPSIGEEIVRQLTLQIDWAKSNHILVAMSGERPVGVLRFVTQRLGEDEERPPIVFRGETLVEGKVISFGVVPEYRNRGIGRALQEKAIELAREAGCYQLRSRSWYHSKANFHLKMSMGSGIQPSLQDDSVYFIIVL
jgi:GNAT superfamily N-acetyltransferase